MAGNDRIPGLHLFGGSPPLTHGSATGRVFWVGNSTTYVPGGVAGVDDIGGHGQSPKLPFATIDYAIGQCVAGRGDVVYVMEGHAETVAGTIALDVAAVRLIGLGVAANRPVLTFDTDSDVLAVTVANTEITNMEFVCNVASLTRFVSLAGGADGCWIHHNMFREGSQTGLSMVEWTGAADDVVIEDNVFYAPTAGNYDEAILITSPPTRGHIRRNFIFGNFDEGSINNPTGNVATLFEIADNQITNLLAGAEAIDLVSACTGMISRNMLSTDAIATAIVDGSMRCNGNLWSSTTDATHGVPIPVTPADTTTADTVLGALFGDGGIAAWPTAATYANGVSIAEVIAYIQDGTRRGSGTTLAANESLADVLYAANGIVAWPAAGAAPANGVSMAEVLRAVYNAVAADGAADSTTVQAGLGRRVTKVGDISSAPDGLFTVTGKCLITLMVGEVTSVLATTQSLALLTGTNNSVIAAATTITSDDPGTLYIVSGDPDLALNGGGTPGLEVAMLTNGSLAPFMINDDTISQSINGAGTGLIQWDLYYIPLEASASIASSA